MVLGGNGTYVDDGTMEKRDVEDGLTGEVNK